MDIKTTPYYCWQIRNHDHTSIIYVCFFICQQKITCETIYEETQKNLFLNSQQVSNLSAIHQEEVRKHNKHSKILFISWLDGEKDLRKNLHVSESSVYYVYFSKINDKVMRTYAFQNTSIYSTYHPRARLKDLIGILITQKILNLLSQALFLCSAPSEHTKNLSQHLKFPFHLGHQYTSEVQQHRVPWYMHTHQDEKRLRKKLIML